MFEQLRKRKLQLEKEILVLIKDFEKETSTHVEEVNIISDVWQTTKERIFETSSVETSIRI